MYLPDGYSIIETMEEGSGMRSRPETWLIRSEGKNFIETVTLKVFSKDNPVSSVDPHTGQHILG